MKLFEGLDVKINLILFRKKSRVGKFKQQLCTDVVDQILIFHEQHPFYEIYANAQTT